MIVPALVSKLSLRGAVAIAATAGCLGVWYVALRALSRIL